MKPHDRPSALDVAIVCLSPLIVAVMTVVFLAGWWAQGLYGWIRGTE